MMPRPWPRLSFGVLLAGAGLLTSTRLPAQIPDPGGPTALSASDSTDLVDELRDRQLEFEHLRESRIPVTPLTGGGGCDERIGRICIWFGGEGESSFPQEPLETARGRGELIDQLTSGLYRIGDPWIFGQLVHYLAEAGNLPSAERTAERCGITDTWWCSALLGYVLHLDGRFVEAEAAFRTAVANLPEEEVERWTTPRFIVSEDEEERISDLDDSERERSWEMLWRLSDPLFMEEGNDYLTEHYARLVLARNREEAENPHLMIWGEDLEETLIRYGREIGWSRVIGMPTVPMGDSRSTWGHHHPMSRGYLFPEEFLRAPADVLPESWVTTPRESRNWYVAPYAPDFRGLDTQVARFRRGDDMLVIAAYRPTPTERDPFVAETPVAPPAPRNPFARGGFGQPAPAPAAQAAPTDAQGPVRAALFLMPEAAGSAPISAERTDREGVMTLTAPAGRYVSSVEVFEPEAGRAWRARQGVVQDPMVMGLVALSDLLILREGAPIPADLDEATALARPGVRVRSAEQFVVAWEVYGLGVDQEVEVTLGFTEGRPAFLTRVGEFLGIVEPADPVEITFTDAGADNVQTLFRAIEIGLPELEPGEYTLHVRLDLFGREPSITSRPIIVTP
jgi:hypothetical protein